MWAFSVRGHTTSQTVRGRTRAIIGHTLKVNLQLFCRSTPSWGRAIYRTVLNRRVQHIKTALMISLVVLIYILAFMPAWLMALEVLTYNVVIFYLYFTYNVANPIIYTFMKVSETIFRLWHHVEVIITV